MGQRDREQTYPPWKSHVGRSPLWSRIQTNTTLAVDRVDRMGGSNG